MTLPVTVVRLLSPATQSDSDRQLSRGRDVSASRSLSLGGTHCKKKALWGTGSPFWVNPCVIQREFQSSLATRIWGVDVARLEYQRCVTLDNCRSSLSSRLSLW